MIILINLLLFKSNESNRIEWKAREFSEEAVWHFLRKICSLLSTTYNLCLSSFCYSIKFSLLRKKLLLLLAYIFLIFVESVWFVPFFLKGLTEIDLRDFGHVYFEQLLYLRLQALQGFRRETGKASILQIYGNINSTENGYIRSWQAPVKPIKPVISSMNLAFYAPTIIVFLFLKWLTISPHPRQKIWQMCSLQ